MALTPRPTSLWHRIRTGFDLPDMTSPLVTEQEEWFSKRPDYIARTVQRSSRYLYYIVEQIEKRGMPSEIALLPIIESAYNPVAYSRAHASGIWQFIPSTGKHYGLQQNFWYDGRRDVMAAPNAAPDSPKSSPKGLAAGIWHPRPLTGAKARWGARRPKTWRGASPPITAASACRMKRAITCPSCRR